LKLIQKLQNIKIKICGIKNTAILDCCNKFNVNYYGLIFYKNSPRNITVKDAIKLVKNKKINKSIAVGVFVNHDIYDLIELIKIIDLKYIQLHGNENNDYISRLKDKFDLKIIKAIGIQNENDFKQIKSFSQADFLLFDYKSKKNELPGGNSKSFNWSIIKEKSIAKPWFISGGINKKNINEILENLTPYGIDISSGVEDYPGIKNPKKIKEIVKLINEQ